MTDQEFPVDGEDHKDVPKGSFFSFCRDTMGDEEHSCMRRFLADCISCGMCVRTAPRCRHLEYMLGLSPETRLPDDHLKADELKACRASICSFIGSQDIPVEKHAPIMERFFENLAFFTRGGVFRGIAAFCVVLVLGNSVALAASETVPGDALYSVKINVMEPARAMVMVTAAGRAQWASNCVKRRLVEAERLIARKELTSAHWATIEESLDRHVTVAKRHINRLAKKDPESAADLSVNLETTLVAHSTAILDVQENDQDNEVLSSVFDDVSSAASVATELTIDIEGQVSSADEDMERIATRTIQAASSAVSDLDASVREDAAAQSNGQRVKAARSLLDDADVQLKAGQFKQSLNMAKQAARRAEEGKVFLRMGLIIDVDTDTSVSSASFESSGDSSAQAVVAASSTSCSSSLYSLPSQQGVLPPAEESSSSKRGNYSSSSSSAQTSVPSDESSVSVEIHTSAKALLPVSIPLPSLP